MEKVKICKSGVVPNIVNYDIADCYDNLSKNVYEYYFKQQHYMETGYTVAVYHHETQFHTLARIRLRNAVKLGINNARQIKWRYADNSNPWQDAGTFGSTFSLPGYVGFYDDHRNSFSNNFQIQCSEQDGKLMISSYHSGMSPIFQEFISSAELSSEIHSEKWIIRTVVVKDSYIRTQAFSRMIDVPIVDRKYDTLTTNENGDNRYVFYTDYLWNDIEKKYEDILDPSKHNMYINYYVYDNFILTGGRPSDYMDEDDVNQTVASSFDMSEYNADLTNKNISEDIEYIKVTFQSTICPETPPYWFIITSDIQPNMVAQVKLRLDIREFTLKRDASFFNIPLPTARNFLVHIQQENLIKSHFVDVEIAKSINPVVDNERTEFRWYYKVGEKFFKVDILYIYPVFLTKSLEYPEESGTDYANDSKHTLLRELGFADDDFKYQKKTTQNTFLTLLYYNDQNPANQDLEYYSTLFMDYNLHTNILFNNIGYIQLREELEPPKTLPSQKLLFVVEKQTISEHDNILPYLFVKEEKDEPENVPAFIRTKYNCGASIFLYGKDYTSQKPTPLYIRVEFNNARNGKKTLLFNREQTDKVAMNNVFFDLESEKQFCYLKVWAHYSPEVEDFIVYPDEEQFTEVGDPKEPPKTKPFYVESGKENRKLYCTLYEVNIK